MSITGDQYLDIKSKKLLGLTDIQTRLFQYLKSSGEQTYKHLNDFFIPDGVTITADGNDKFKIAKDVAGVIGTDGLGNFFDIDETTKAGIKFENTNAVNYYVGLKHCAKPVGIMINPRTGSPQYECFEDQIGLSAAPDAVVNNGTNITFTVNSVTEDNVDNSGRVVLVWLVTPAEDAITEAIAIEECTVAYVSTDNKITTTGLLGQTTVSTTAADYMCACIGPTVKKNTDLSTVSGYAYVGYVTGAGAGNPPTSFNHFGQTVFPGSWADMILDGFENDLIPVTNNDIDVGSSSKKLAYVYTTRLHVDDTPITGGLANNLNPIVDNAINLGNDSYAYQNTYTYNLYYQYQYTFDNEDDLELIEQFKPSGETVKVKKGNVEKEVQKCDVNTLPWPMLGPKDSKGNSYIDLADSTGFFLGAIKQLYKKHKEEVSEMKEIIKSLTLRLETIENK